MKFIKKLCAEIFSPQGFNPLGGGGRNNPIPKCSTLPVPSGPSDTVVDTITSQWDRVFRQVTRIIRFLREHMSIALAFFSHLLCVCYVFSVPLCVDIALRAKRPPPTKTLPNTTAVPDLMSCADLSSNCISVEVPSPIL